MSTLIDILECGKTVYRKMHTTKTMKEGVVFAMLDDEHGLYYCYEADHRRNNYYAYCINRQEVYHGLFMSFRKPYNFDIRRAVVVEHGPLCLPAPA